MDCPRSWSHGFRSLGSLAPLIDAGSSSRNGGGTATKLASWFLLAFTWWSRLLSAQTAITADDLVRHIGVLANDSMRGRDTPSRGLELTAQYLAVQFEQLDTKPGVSIGHEYQDNRKNVWVWRYSIPGQRAMDYARSHVTFSLAITKGGKDVLTEAKGTVTKPAITDFATAAHFVSAVGPPVVTPPKRKFFDILRMGSERTVVIAGPHTVASAARVVVQDKVVIYIPSADVDSIVRRQILARLYAESQGVVLVSGLDAASFAAAVDRARQQPVPVVDSYMREATGVRRWPWAVEVLPEALRDWLGAAGVDLARARTDSIPVVRELPFAQVWLEPDVDTTMTPVTAPVVVGILEGTDSVLKDEYLVFSAHMDADGLHAGPGNRLDNGADDNASGTAGLLALARAFSQPGARPRRSLLFLATSGGARGKISWGSNAYLDPNEGGRFRTMVADLNLDRIGRLAGDSVLVAGLRDVELVPTPEWVAAEHPDLGLVVASGGTAINPTSDLFPFVRRTIPSLSFYTGSHEAVSAGGDIPAAVNAEGAARILRFVFHVAQSIANADQPPRWSAEGRQRLVEFQKP